MCKKCFCLAFGKFANKGKEQSFSMGRGGGGANIKMESGCDSATHPINAVHDFVTPVI